MIKKSLELSPKGRHAAGNVFAFAINLGFSTNSNLPPKVARKHGLKLSDVLEYVKDSSFCSDPLPPRLASKCFDGLSSEEILRWLDVAVDLAWHVSQKDGESAQAGRMNAMEA